jgi:Uma2 family endonuclease
MPTELPRIHQEIIYHWAAQEYLRKLPLEHFMEATPQATQREITLESFALIQRVRPDVHRFNELLVQYPLPKPKGKKKIGQVVPDNMVVLHDGPIDAVGSYDLPFQPVGPLLVLEYVSKNSERKDFEINMLKYERELKVPYYLLYYPEVQELTLYRHTGEKFVSEPPNENGRYPIPQLELEAAILDGWVRYWFRGKLLLLPADLQDQVENLGEQLQQKDEQLQQAQRRADALAAELEHLRQQMGKAGA